MGRKKKAGPAADAAQASAQDIVARAQAAVEELSGQGVDVGALTDRLSAALESLTSKEYRAAEMAAGEIVVLAKAMKEMAALSGGIAQEEETERATIVDAISSEVSRQVKDVMRDIPMEIAKQIREATKRLPMDLAKQVQDNLGSYPTADRVEEMATRRASQATQDLLLSKEFEDKVAKLVTSSVERLPNLTHSDATSIAKEVMTESLNALLASKKFKKEVSDVVEGSSKITVEDAKELLDEGLKDKATKADLDTAIADLAGKEGLEKAISTLLEGDELAAKVKTVLEDVPRLSPDDVSGIASGVASQAVQAALASDEWTERVRSLVDEVVSRFGETVDQSINSLTAGLIKGTAFDEKMRAVTGESIAEFEGRLPEFKEEVRRSVLEEVAPAVSAIIASEGFATRVGELIDEKMKAAVEEKLSAIDELKAAVEELKAHAPEDALEEAKKAAKAELAAIVDSEMFLSVVGEAAKRSGVGELDEEKVVEIAKEEVLQGQANIIDLHRLKIIELAREQVLDMMGSSSQAVDEEKVAEIVKEAVAEKLGAGLDPAMLEGAIKQAAPAAVKEIATSDEFKKMLDDKFRVITRYLREDLVPKTVKKLVGG